MNMELIQETNLEDEAAVIAVNETKKKYLKMSPGGSLSAEIKQRLDSLPETDTLFVKYVNSLVTGQLDLHSTEEKCMRIIGKETLSRQVSEVMQRRNAAVAAYLQEKQLPATRYKIRNAQPDMQLQRSAPPKYIIQLGTE
jgi:predicted transcriptional regulator